jgi:mannose-1-phosphate guanylyltransferase
MLTEGAVIRGVTTVRNWHDLGTPRRYLDAALARLAAAGLESWVAPGAAVAASARLEATVVEDGARVEEGVVLERALVLPGARVGAGATVEGSIVGFDAEVPAGATVVAELVSGRGAASTRRPLGSSGGPGG